MGRLVALAMLALVFAEIAGFVIIGSRIGVLATLAWVVLAAMLGLALIKRQGLDALRRAQAALRRGESPTAELADGALVTLAGVLLVIPGFVTDAFGLLLAIRPVRTWLIARLRTPFANLRCKRPDLVQLDIHEYREVPPGDTPSPWQRP